jgi:hypothetical protein
MGPRETKMEQCQNIVTFVAMGIFCGSDDRLAMGIFCGSENSDITLPEKKIY